MEIPAKCLLDRESKFPFGFFQLHFANVSPMDPEKPWTEEEIDIFLACNPFLNFILLRLKTVFRTNNLQNIDLLSKGLLENGFKRSVDSILHLYLVVRTGFNLAYWPNFRVIQKGICICLGLSCC